MRLILKPDWDPSNPYHYHVNDQKIVITPEDWEKYKDDPTFREIRAAVEAEQAAYPEPEYDEIENPAWRKAYQNLVNGVNLKGRSNYLQPLPLGYTRDAKGVPMDAQGNYYLPVETASDKPYFVNLEKGMMGHIVPVRYELLQMPDRTIRQLRQPLSVDRVMNVSEERDKSIRSYKTPTFRYKFNLPGYGSTGHIDDSSNKRIHRPNDDRWYFDIPKGNAYTHHGIPSELEPIAYMGFTTTDFVYPEQVYKSLGLDNNGYGTETQIKALQERFKKLGYDTSFNSHTHGLGPLFELETIMPSRQEAEKKAVISIGDLEKVGTFAEGGKLISKYLDGGNITTYPFGFNVYDDPTTWINWWYSNRTPQLINAAPEAQKSSDIRSWFKSYRVKKGKEYAKNFVNSITPILNQYSEASINPNFYGIKQLGSPEVNKNNEKLKQTVESAGFKVGNSLDLIDYGKLLGKVIKGTTFPEDRIINYYTSDPSTVIHERIHAIMPSNIFYKYPIHKQIFPFESYLKENNEYDSYLDDPSEIYSRLMLFRFNNKINPKHKYTILEIKNFRKLDKFKDNYLDRYTDDFLLHLFNEVADNTKLDEEVNYSKRGGKLIKKCLNGERVNMSKLVTNSKGIPLKVDNNLLEELDNFLIKQNVGLPQRLAILYTVVQEGSTAGSHGNGAYGYLGWRGSRIPGKGVNQMQYLYDTIFGEFNKDLWNHGGTGSGYMSGREALQSFINATNVNDALRSLNYGYVRPELELREFRSKTKYFNEDEETD